MADQYAHWDGEFDKGTVVLQEDLNEVHVPKRLKNALGNHRYGRAIDPKNNQPINAYIKVEYEHQEYPKMLYHPKYAQTNEPNLADYAAGCTTPEQSVKAHEAYKIAFEKWQKANRTKWADTPEREAELIAKGWIAAPPRKKVAAGTVESDEI